MKTFVGLEESNKVYKRSLAHGYKYLVIDDEVKMASPLSFVTDTYEGENALRVTVDKTVEGKVENPQFTFMCKEFGIYGAKNNMYAKVSVIFCDDGNMLVTLLDGTLILNINDDLVQPVVGGMNTTKVVADEITWINADFLLARREYFTKVKFANVNVHDFEYVFTLKADVDSFTLRREDGEYVDLSLGYTALLEEQELKKKQALEAKKLVSLTTGGGSFSGFEFDDDDEDDDELEFEDDFYEDED